MARPPRIRVAPVGADCSWAEEAVKLSRRYLVDPYDWQEDVLRSWLARRGSRYACGTCGLIVPRQNGKSKAVVSARMLLGAAVAGEAIRYSAHRVDTMLEIFEIFVEMFGDPRLPEDEWPHPELHKRVRKFNFNNGHQRIEFASGGFIRFVSRSTGAGRGSTVDVNIYDEAQFLTDEQVAASTPNKSAGPRKDPQTIYLGTPPSDPGCYAEPFSRARKAALEGKPRRCWHEWSVDEPGDVTDRSRWYATNPSLGLSLLEDAVADEIYELGPTKFAIERLCWWPEATTDKAMSVAKWDAGADGSGPADEDILKFAAGVKFSPDGQRVCLSWAQKLESGAHVELIFDEFTSDGVGEMVEWVAERSDLAALVAVDGRAGGQDFVDRCRAAGVPRRALRLMTTQEVVAAATKLAGMVAEGSLTHCPDEGLDASARGAVRRRIGGDGFGFGGDSCPIESAASAVWAVMTTKRNPGRGDMLG